MSVGLDRLPGNAVNDFFDSHKKHKKSQNEEFIAAILFVDFCAFRGPQTRELFSSRRRLPGRSQRVYSKLTASC